MSGGGIIIQRHAVLVPAIVDPSFFNYLSKTKPEGGGLSDQEQALAISRKGPDGATDEDNTWMLKKLREVQCRGPGIEVGTT